MRFFGLEFSYQNTEKRGDAALQDRFFQNITTQSSAGVYVTPDSARRHAAVYAAVRVLSETIATLPLILYRRTKSGSRERASDLGLYETLNHQPNDLNTRVEFVEVMMNHLLLRGNFYAQKVFRNVRGVRDRNLSLVILQPDQMQVEVAKTDSGQNVFKYTYKDSAGTKEFSAEDILHIKFHSDDGVKGKSIISHARDVIGLGLSLDQYAANTFKEGTRLGGVLESDDFLDDDSAERIAKSWRQSYGGSHNAGKIPVLEGGLKFRQVTMTNEDAEFVNQRELQINEIARIFRIPPHMIGDLRRSTFSNIEMQAIEFVTHTIRPWAVRIEQALMKSLIPPRSDLFIEFLLEGLLRGDAAARGAFYNSMFHIGAYSPNMILAKENENGIGEDGDKHFVPVNMVPIDKASEILDQNNDGRPDSNSRGVAKEDYRAGFLPILEQGFERILNREALAVARHGKRKEGREFEEWLVDFYQDHRQFVEDTLKSVVSLFCMQNRVSDFAFDEYLQNFITKRFTEALEIEDKEQLSKNAFSEANDLLDTIVGGNE